MAILTAILPFLSGIIQALFGGTVNQEVAHSPATLAQLGLDSKSLVGVEQFPEFKQ